MTKIRNLIAKLGKSVALNTDECGVRGCNRTHNVEVVELKPLDPIDHDGTLVAVCSDHQEWAQERNEFAEEMTDQLRERRKELGKANIERIQELNMPQGKQRKDILMGDPEEEYIHIEDAFEEDKQLDGVSKPAFMED